jgi:hypothetical protein
MPSRTARTAALGLVPMMSVVTGPQGRKINKAARKAEAEAVAQGLDFGATTDYVTAASRKALTFFTGYEYVANGMVRVAG